MWDIFNKLCESGSKILTSKEFLKFLNEYQRDPRLNEILYPYATEEKANSLIKKYEPNQHLVSRNELSCEGKRESVTRLLFMIGQNSIS